MKKVITYGSFDLFHEGHYQLLKRAKALGDYLIVGVTTQEYDEARGKLNIVEPISARMAHVKESGFADEIIVEDHPGQKLEDILKYQIDIFTVGSDWRGYFEHLRPYCQVVYLERTRNVSSTRLRGERFSVQRLGIVGCGRIAHRFVPEAKYVSGVSVQGVYHPDREKAQRFQLSHQLDFSSDDLSAFFQQVDAVYIASPHSTHYAYAKQALLTGKHVLCEKPMVLMKAQATELFELARQRGLVLLEAVKTAFAPGYRQLLSIARSGVLGEIRDVEASFSRLTSPGLREYTDPGCAGSFTEFASYTMLPLLDLLGEPKQAMFFPVRNDQGVDLYTKALFSFTKGGGLSKTGIGVKTEGQLIVAGTRAYLLAEAPWWKTSYFEVRYEDPLRRDRYCSRFLGDGLRYEIRDFVQMIREGNLTSYKMPPAHSIVMAHLMETFLAQSF